uniref:Precorrin-6y C5,15-methyltransferase (Decarboxylating) subunit CbiE n=1 Tax=Fundidesulfovibrio putealis TaxID=270496 RepID=A0A7C3WG47_9BACT
MGGVQGGDHPGGHTGNRAGARVRPIRVVGLGVGAHACPQIEAAVRGADVLCAGERLLARFPGFAGERVVLKAPLDAALDVLEARRAQGGAVLVLADGDPLHFGIGALLARRFGPQNLVFSPGVTTVQLAAARLGLPWQELPAVSLHGRHDPAPFWAALWAAGQVAVYTGPGHGPGELARMLLDMGLDGARLHVLEDLGEATERVRELTPAQALELDFSPLNLVIVHAPQEGLPRPVPGAPDQSYSRERELITKWPVRAAALAGLRLGPGQTLWDVGAGSGAVGIEACALLGRGAVYAVERDASRCEMILGNARRHGAWQLRVVQGAAPAALEPLPEPDRVFIGGGLGQGADVLRACCQRLAPGGRLALTTVLLASLTTALEHLRALGWAFELTQLQAAHGSPLAGDLRLTPINPVFLLTADKPEKS